MAKETNGKSKTLSTLIGVLIAMCFGAYGLIWNEARGDIKTNESDIKIINAQKVDKTEYQRTIRGLDEKLDKIYDLLLKGK